MRFLLYLRHCCQFIKAGENSLAVELGVGGAFAAKPPAHHDLSRTENNDTRPDDKRENN